jgi:RNA polymerase sporulation-specific sigma factor
MPEKEKIRLLEKSQSGDSLAREELVNGNLRLVLSVVQKFVNRGESLDDLFQVGCIGLIKSIDNFDLSQNTKFSTYAVPMIIGEIKRYLRDNSSIHVSRSVRDTAYRAMHVKEKLIAEKNREPSTEEIAEELGISKEEVAISLEAIVEPVSLYEPMYSENSENVCLIDQIKDSNDDSCWDDEIALRQAILGLDKREKLILSMRFLSGMTQNEVAKRLKISQAQVSRVEKYAIKKIKHD